MMSVIMKKTMKIKFNSNDNLPLNKPLKFHNMTITIWSVFKETLYASFSRWYFVWVKYIKC